MKTAREMFFEKYGLEITNPNHVAFHVAPNTFIQFAEEYAKQLSSQPEWIDVKTEENPKDYQAVLVLLENGEIFKATFCDDIYNIPFSSEYFKLNRGVKVTHWQPLPTPPQQ